MRGESSRCPNCETPISGNSDYCEKCGMRLYFRCGKCGGRWFRMEGTLCSYCGERATNDYEIKTAK